MSIDGGIQGMHTDILSKKFDNLDIAYKNATKAIKEAGPEASEDLIRSRDIAKSKIDAFRKDMSAGLGPAEMHANVLSRDGFGESEIGKRMAKDLLKEYYVGGTKERNVTRISASVGAYAGVNVGMRSLTGGSIGYNNKGERDIAGIPIF